MAKRLSIKAKTELLEEFKRGNVPENHLQLLRQTLADKNYTLVALAAEIIERFKYLDMVPDLESAFNRLIKLPYKADIGCVAKIAIVKALDQLNYTDCDDIFQRGISFEQLEPAYGDPDDTAAQLRALCAMSLARLEHHDIFFLLATLLMDREPQARTGAVRSLVYLNSRESELLLRMRIMSGEPHPDVLAECFSGLVQINGERSLGFLAGFLEDRDPVIAEEAAIALGESHQLEAFHILCRHREEAILSSIKQKLLLPIALTRRDEAVEYLLEILRSEHEKSAAAAVKALSIFRSHDGYREKIQQAVDNRSERVVAETYRDHF